jgi:RNA polymerase sigma-70 factor (ECF subfamily)
MCEQRLLEQRFAARQDDAFREVYQRFSARMIGVAYQVLGDRELAADAAQLAFLRAWQACAVFDPQRALEPWLFAITRRAAIDVHRRQRAAHQFSTADPGMYEDPRHVITDDGATRAWVRQQVQAAIGKLPAADRDIVRLVFLAGLTHREAAERLGIPIGTVKSRLFRAQRKMTVLLRHLSEAAAA